MYLDIYIILSFTKNFLIKTSRTFTAYNFVKQTHKESDVIRHSFSVLVGSNLTVIITHWDRLDFKRWNPYSIYPLHRCVVEKLVICSEFHRQKNFNCLDFYLKYSFIFINKCKKWKWVPFIVVFDTNK